MNLTKCYNGHYYDADKYDECPHCEKSADNIETVPAGGIVMRKCNWCGLESPLPYDAELCPHCTNNLNGTPNETTKEALQHYHNGVKFYNDKYFENAKKDFLWNKEYNLQNINFFVISKGDLPIEHIKYYEGKLFYYNRINGSRDGRMSFPDDFFETQETILTHGEIASIFDYMQSIDFSKWKTSETVINNIVYGADGFCANETFKVEFVGGQKYTFCLDSAASNNVKTAFNELFEFLSNFIPDDDKKDITDTYKTNNEIEQNTTVLFSGKKKESLYCPKCGETLSAEALFCTKCGANIRIEPEQTLFLCMACHSDCAYGDRFCRHCGIDLSLIDTQSAIENEDDVQYALFTIEKLIEFHNRNDKDEWVLAKLLNLINYTPLYLAVDMDMQAMFSDINPEDLKPGDVITNKQDVHMKILTANVGDLEVIPMFTKGEYANASVIRQYPSDYLPMLIKMNKPVVINLFNDERFALPAQFLNHMLEVATGEKGVTDEIKCPVCGTDLPDGAKFCFKCGTQLNKDSETTVIKEGTVIQGKYKLIKKICETGHNTTLYLALEERLNKTWAVKIFDKKDFNDEETMQTHLNMFVSQTNFLKKLDHPSIARVVDIIEESNFACIVTEYVEGENLYKIVQQFGPQPEQTVLSWARQLCNTLIYLAGQKPPIIHRGISPRNIILQTNGTIKLMDFSIAREYIEGLEADEIALGIKGYAPPEQYGGAQTDCRSDIYALGSTMHFLLTGVDSTKPPYEQNPIRTYNSNLSKGMEYIICKCLMREPRDRYQNPLELLTDLYNIEKLPPKASKIKGLFKR